MYVVILSKRNILDVKCKCRGVKNGVQIETIDFLNESHVFIECPISPFNFATPCITN